MSRPEKYPLSRTLGLRKGDAVALVGGGGKTSLLYALARENPLGRILCTTSTKMFDPRWIQHPFDRIIPHWQDEGFPMPALERERCFIAGGAVRGQTEKLGALSNNCFSHWQDQTDWPILIIEADGAAGKPLKAAADHEPVIPGCVSILIACIGLDVLGKPLDGRWVHRPELFSRRTGVETGRIIGPEALRALILHKEGLFKGCGKDVRKVLFLNKADALDPAWKIEEIAATLGIPGVKVVAASLAVPPTLRLHCI